jgi:hypothetical protein
VITARWYSKADDPLGNHLRRALEYQHQLAKLINRSIAANGG